MDKAISLFFDAYVFAKRLLYTFQLVVDLISPTERWIKVPLTAYQEKRTNTWRRGFQRTHSDCIGQTAARMFYIHKRV
jgi:hypothetical protein